MTTPSEPVVGRTGSGISRWNVLIPLFTLLVGLALGASVVWAAGADEAAPPALPPAAASPEPTPSSRTVPVVGVCLRAADQADVTYQLVDQAVAAGRDLDARRLQELVDQLQHQQNQTRTLVAACRDQADGT